MSHNLTLPVAIDHHGKSISRISPALLRSLFLHHDGIVLGATLAALRNAGLLERLWQRQRMSVAEIRREFSCSPGYLHVALRCLALQGWVERCGPVASDSLQISVTAVGNDAARWFDRYATIAGFIYSGVPLASYLLGEEVCSAPPFSVYTDLIEDCRCYWHIPAVERAAADAPAAIINGHLDGMLIGPLMIALKMQRWLEDTYFPRLDTFTKPERLLSILALLMHFDWVSKDNQGWKFTDLGKLAADFTLHYGLTWSYYPMFCKLPQLIFNSARHVTHVNPEHEEYHVDRILNVLASGVAHRPYFEESDKVMIEIFNREPLAEQPKFIADMGCGDGAWLKRIYQVVKTRTKRGQYLEEYPLLMVGADYNVKAREVVQNTLRAAGIPNLILFGDVGDPALFARTLRAHDLDISDGLHIRAFIDHNRPYAEPQDLALAETRRVVSTGAFADESGNAISNAYLEQHLIEHLRLWEPYIAKHGLIIIEAHNIDPRIAAHYNGKTHATAFDTYHGYSNQYPVDFEAFIALAEEAGLRTVLYQQRLYPSRLPFVAISLNRFKTASNNEYAPPTGYRRVTGSNEWQPDPAEDLTDGNALHHFLYEGGNISRPRRWCASSTGMLVGSVLEEIENRLQQLANHASAIRTLKVVDYGAGTGFATLELIKGLYEKNLLMRCREHGIDFQLLLFDFPSSWYAKSYELLQAYPFVRFFSLKDPATGKVRLLTDIVEPNSIDIIYASMVFHLVPAPILPILASSFNEALKQTGKLLWNTPDTPPTFTYSEVIHAPNRALRECFLRVLDNPHDLQTILSRVPAEEQSVYADISAQLEQLHRQLTPEQRIQTQQRADKQILPVPSDLHTLKAALEPYFHGPVFNSVAMMSAQDSLALALLPANQRYLNEVRDINIRARVITLILQYEVLPKFRDGPAGNPQGYNLHWTYGRSEKKIK